MESLVLEDQFNSFDDLVHQLIVDILVEVVALALHGILDAVFYGEQSEEEEQVVVQGFFAGVFLVFGELYGGEDPLVYVAPAGSRANVDRDHFLHLMVVHTLLCLFGVRYLLQVCPRLEVRFDVGLQSFHVQRFPVFDEDDQGIHLFLFAVADTLEEDLEDLFVETLSEAANGGDEALPFG